MTEGSSRKLAVIVHADVTDSTGLVRLHETKAHDRIQRAFRSFREIIDSYSGITLELRGDALVAEFQRASDAVAASIAFQAKNEEFNSTMTDEVRPRLRVGVAMGEVVVADNTVTGDGVVLAQRLEQLADPGGVCIQDAAYQTIPKRLPYAYEHLGEQELKGFDEPVRAYAVSLRKDSLVPDPEQRKGSAHSTTKRIALGAVVGVLLVVALGLAWWQPWRPAGPVASVERMAFPLPDKPSIAVLPFTNMSGDPEQEYFVDGMTEDLITDLSKINDLFVIARNSTFTYKGRAVNIPQIAEELGVRYVLEGSVRRAGDQVRINAQLIDATSGGHLWAERYDGKLEDIFAVQDQVTGQIVDSLKLNLTGEPKRHDRSTDNVGAHDAFLQGWSHFRLGRTENLKRSIPYFEEAVRLDPEYAHAHAAVAAAYWDAFVNDWAFDLDMPSFRAEERVNEHLELAMRAPTPLAHSLQSSIYVSMGFLPEAVAEAEKAVALDRNDATALAALANVQVLAGEVWKGEESIRRAMRLDPHHSPDFLTILGAAQFGSKQYEEAIVTLGRAINRDPDDELPRIYLASAYGHLDRLDAAEATIEATNGLRRTRGLGPLSLEKSINNGVSPFRGEINFNAFGTKSNQEHLRAGLSTVPALIWQYLITTTYDWWEGGATWYVKGATMIDMDTANKLHHRGVPFIDVRKSADWDESRVGGAVNLPVEWDDEGLVEPLFRQPEMEKVVGKDEEFVVFWCSSNGLFCSGAFEAARAVAWGYKKVYFLDDDKFSFTEWNEAGYPVERGN